MGCGDRPGEGMFGISKPDPNRDYEQEINNLRDQLRKNELRVANYREENRRLNNAMVDAKNRADTLLGYQKSLRNLEARLPYGFPKVDDEVEYRLDPEMLTWDTGVMMGWDTEGIKIKDHKTGMIVIVAPRCRKAQPKAVLNSLVGALETIEEQLSAGDESSILNGSKNLGLVRRRLEKLLPILEQGIDSEYGRE